MPASKRIDLRVDGLKEAIAEMRASPERLDKELRRSFREISADVRDKARAAAEAQHPHSVKPHAGPMHWKDLVNSITSGADSDSPFVKIGSDRVPWGLGFEFGSATHHQFPAWRGNKGGAGYFFWPTIRESRESVQEKALEAIDQALKPAFPE